MSDFKGDQKAGKWLLASVERKFIDKSIPRLPGWLETYHLTAMTLLWSAGAVLSGYLAGSDPVWFWVVSLMIIFQYITDSFDGSLGKYRNTGLVKWGFYMDHFLDFIFMSSLMLAYFFITPRHAQIYVVILLILVGGFMVNSYLHFAALNEFRFSFLRLGPTEGRILLILFNTIPALGYWDRIVPFLPTVTVILAAALFFSVYQNHKRIWKVDMEAKQDLME